MYVLQLPSLTIPYFALDQAPAAKKAKVTTPAAAVADPNASSTVFVGNMSWGTDEESLRAAFDGIGEITSVRVGEQSWRGCDLIV